MTQEAISAAPRQRRKLSEIVEEFEAVLEESGGEVTARVDELGLELEDKVSAYHAVISMREAEVKALKDMAKYIADSYAEKIQARSNQAEGLKFRLAEELKKVPGQKVKTPTCSAYFSSSKRVHVENEAQFLESCEDRFVKTTHELKKQVLKDALEAGEEHEGAALVTSKHLVLR